VFHDVSGFELIGISILRVWSPFLQLIILLRNTAAATSFKPILAKSQKNKQGFTPIIEKEEFLDFFIIFFICG